ERVAGGDPHSQLEYRGTCGADVGELVEDGGALGIAALGVKCMRIRSGMDFADLGADPRRSLDLSRFGVDEDAGDDAGSGQGCNDAFEPRLLARDVEAAFGSPFLPALRNGPPHLGFTA